MLDFYCAEARLVVEADGGQHYSAEGAARDAERTRYLEAGGLRVLGFSKREVFAETEAVVTAIWTAVVAGQRTPSS